MKWISVEQALPINGQAVLVRRVGDNWNADHYLADGQLRHIWRWVACRFIRGRTKDEVRASGYSTMEDQIGNNERPYCWKEFGPGCLFGQDVSHWVAITDPLAPQEPSAIFVNGRRLKPGETTASIINSGDD